MIHVTHVNESCHIGTLLDLAMMGAVNESCRTCE